MAPDGHMMLYASFNDSLVEEMHISWFGEGNKALYPDIRSLRYPKVREKLSKQFRKIRFFVPILSDEEKLSDTFSSVLLFLLAGNAKSVSTAVRC